MTNRLSTLAVAAFFATSLASLANVASAMPFDALAVKNAAPTDIEAVYWRGTRWGWGAGAGFVGGAILGGMLAAPYYYGPRPYYGYGPYYRARGYYSGNAVAYCLQRFRSYDVGSGTYLGYDGYRHPCP